jgi:regulator of sigma E protease
MELFFYIIIAILALSVLVFFHELGHYIAAKLFGVKVERFSIGFGKPFYKVNWLDTEWAFAPILLGGYVKMKGQDDINPLERSSDPDSYNSKKPWQRIIILLAGPLANIILAFFIYLIIAFSGAPVSTASPYVAPVVGSVKKDTPAYKAGLKEGDKILEIGNFKIKYWYEIGDAIQKSKEPIPIKIKRGDKVLTLYLKPTLIESKNEFNETIKRKIIGIAPKIEKGDIVKFSPLEALKYAYNETIKATLLITKGVQKISTGEVDSKNISGAITIFDILIQFAKEGLLYLMFITALISVNLGVLNLLPIPALDGGHIVFNLYEMITKKPPSEKVLYNLTLAGWVFLIGLMMFGLYNDINRIWG